MAGESRYDGGESVWQRRVGKMDESRYDGGE